MSSAPSYEAYCPSCRVSHPPGTRRCIHCGGDVMRERPADVGGMRDDGAPEISDFFESGADGGAEADETEAAGRRAPPGGMRVAISLLWVALAVAISVYRGCQGG